MSRFSLFAPLFRPRPRVAALSDIPTPVYERMITELCADGWTPGAAYGGFDAGIDYDSVTLRKAGETLKFSWERSFEGSVRGPEVLVGELREKYPGAGEEQ